MRKSIYDPLTGEYLGTVELTENPEEPGKFIGGGPWSLDAAPPDVIPPGFVAVVNARRDGFSLVEDHRGERGYVGDEPVTIKTLGPLPDGWSDSRPIPPDTRTPEEKRHAAYIAEADVFRDQALSYQAEADAWRLAGNEDSALKAEEKASAALASYLAKKEEIRARFPDPRYRLASSGIYHADGCSYASSGDWLTLAEIAAARPDAKACGRCKPPAFPAE